MNPMSPVATEAAAFTFTLTLGAPGMPVAAGQILTISFGDGTSSQNITDVNGQIALTHTYATAGTYSIAASFAGLLSPLLSLIYQI